MIAFDFNPDLHWMPPGGSEVARFLRRRLKWPRLLVYLHKRTRNWVVAEWRPGKVGESLEDLLIICHEDDGRLMDNLTRDKVQQLDYLLNGPTPEDACKVISRQPRRQLQEIQDWHDEECEARNYLAKRTDELNVGWGV